MYYISLHQPSYRFLCFMLFQNNNFTARFVSDVSEITKHGGQTGKKSLD